MLPTSPRVNSAALAMIFSKTTNSYKYFFMLAVLQHSINDEQNKNGKVRLLDLAAEMLLMAGFFTINFKISLGRQDMLAEILSRFANTKGVKNSFVKHGDRGQLRSVLKEWLLKNKADKNTVLKYVPYRMLTTFFANNLVGVADYKKNTAINTLANEEFESRKPLYKINVEKGCIDVHSDWICYLKGKRQTNPPINNL